jgi:microsomal dipeptidase-like Zn-dependent dipeptidase
MADRSGFQPEPEAAGFSRWSVHMRFRSYALVAVVLVIVGSAVFFGVVPREVARRNNPVAESPPYPVSPAASVLHASLFVADLHADSLLWERDLLVHDSIGQVDIPRLIKGNVGLQVFSAVTRVPFNRNLKRNSGDGVDVITWLAIAERWPLRTWASVKQRALYQAKKLQAFADNSDGQLVLIRSRDDLEHYLSGRTANGPMVAGLLALEGAQVLEGDVRNVDVMYAAGYRMLGMVHLYDNETGGSAHGERKPGLTRFGREVVERAEALNMILDVAHASQPLFDDVLAMATRPVVSSHTGVRGTCEGSRNLTDAQLHAIAATGGVVGIGYWPKASCGEDVTAIIRSIRYAADLVGVEHLALGSDFDGSVQTPFDTTGVAQITAGLLADGFSEADITKIMGGNVARLLQAALPPR